MNLVFVCFAVVFLTPAEQPREERIQELVREIANSGSVLEAGDRQVRLADPRLTLAPGVPPLLSFRYFQGADRGRFGKLDLMLDDAGH
jgi:hypothetical protein